MIHTETPERILTVLKDYQEESVENEEEDMLGEEISTEKLTHEKMTPDQQDTVFELMDDLDCPEEIAVLAITELGCSKTFGM